MTRRQRKAFRSFGPDLIAWAQREPSREVCGLLGWDGRTYTLYPCRNAASEPESTFCVDANDQLDAFGAMEARGEEFFAVIHSHPSEGAALSKTDRFFREFYGAAHWVIVGLKGEDGPEVFVAKPLHA